MKAFNKVSDFTNLYSLSKTLRFEAKPIGKTLENLKKSGILEQDLKRAEKYLQLKKIIDEYHKDFIEQALSGRKLDGYYLESYKDLYFKRNKDDKEKEDFKAVSENLRKNIFIFFRDDRHGKESKEKLKKMLKADLIKELLPEFIKQNSKRLLSLFDKDPDSGIKSEDDLNETLKCFEKFTVYFTGFNENRENLYSSEEESTAIAYRSIDENLPIFLNNNEAFEKIVNVLTKDIETLSSDFNIDDISKFFSVNFYSNFLTQKNIDLYNAAIGGKTLENGNKIQGLNEYINLYNQQQKEKGKKLPFLKPLKKQILSDRKNASFLPKQFKDDRELLNAIEDFYAEYGKKQKEIKDLLQKLSDFDLSKIYLKNDAELKNILSKTYGSYQILDIAIGEKFEKDKPIGKKKLEIYEKEKERFIKSFGSFSIQEINGYLSGSDNAIAVENYFKQCGKTESGGDFFEEIEKTRGDIKILLENREIKSLIQDKDSIEKIKSFLDNLKKLQWLIKPLLGAENESDRDIEFYNRVIPIDNFFNENLTPLYNRVRNYLTRNPYSDVKVKLNFENPTLLDGWDKNKETDNTSVLLRKDGLYYLAIMSRGHNKIFESDSVYIAGDISIPSYEKMDYKLLPGPNKMLPKVFFSKKGDKKYSPSAELLNKYEDGLHKKGDKFDIKFMRELIDFFKDSIKKNEEWDCFDFHFSDTGSYEDISGFYREVEAQGYKISFRKIPQDYIDKAVEEGKIYLFQIYNKDFSQYSKGHPNLHTIYWRALFDEENIKNPIFKLNGEAEIFYREKTKDLKEVIHKAGEFINNKNKNGGKEKSKFPYDIRKDKRYSEDKILFHTPITLNFKGEGISNLNESVNAYIKNEKIKHIIGIDRGERHLLYLSLIDLKGNIVEQFSLNKIVNEYEGKEYSVDYCDLLVKKEGERNEARKNWQAISNIKEIKEGYLSQAVHKISKMIVEKEAIVIMEDLNMSFMRERQKVERQVYQKFEKMLIDKLNFLV
ncbi:MAG: type V CRISPR-associated protein Cas12a/Cpf1, partial [Elusimicrobiota bacterium]|nr:type V CRISPR-associated protein Cas12a/Cpf1 [Elusimicrobiota bacterium]